MAQTTMTLTCKTSWWVRPYLYLATAALWAIGHFASDEQIRSWAAAQAEFIVKRGMRIGTK